MGSRGGFYEKSDLAAHVSKIEKRHVIVGMACGAGRITLGRISEVLDIGMKDVTSNTLQLRRGKGSRDASFAFDGPGLAAHIRSRKKCAKPRERLFPVPGQFATRVIGGRAQQVQGL